MRYGVTTTLQPLGAFDDFVVPEVARGQPFVGVARMKLSPTRSTAAARCDGPRRLEPLSKVCAARWMAYEAARRPPAADGDELLVYRCRLRSWFVARRDRVLVDFVRSGGGGRQARARRRFEGRMPRHSARALIARLSREHDAARTVKNTSSRSPVAAARPSAQNEASAADRGS